MIEEQYTVSTNARRAGLALAGAFLALLLCALLLAAPGRAIAPGAGSPVRQAGLLQPPQPGYVLAVTMIADRETVIPGDLILYTLTFSVTGEVVAEGVAITATVPAGTAYSGCMMYDNSGSCDEQDGVVTWSLGELSPTAHGEVGLLVKAEPSLPHDTPICNQAEIHAAEGDPVSSDVVCLAVTSSHTLHLAKDGWPAEAVHGGFITYTLTYTATGDEPAAEVSITDPLPSGTAFEDCTPDPCEEKAGTVTWYVGTLTPTAKSDVTDTVELLLRVFDRRRAPREVVNTATIRDEDGLTAVATATTRVLLENLFVFLPSIVAQVPPAPLDPIWHQGDLPAGLSVYAIAGCTADCTTLYAGTGDGVYVSQDGGLTWPVHGLAGQTVRGVAVAPGACGMAYATTWGSGLQMTTDAGLSWTPVNNGLGNLSLYAVVIHPADPQVLYAGTLASGVYKSLTAGASWAPVNNGLPADALVDTLAIVPGAPDVVYAGTWGQGLFRSGDGGGSWTRVALAGHRVYAVAIDPTGAVYAGSYEGGVYRSANGVDGWLLEGLAGQIVYSVAVRQDGTAYAGTTGAETVYARDASGAWQALAGQPAGASQARGLAAGREGCQALLFAGTDAGAWWYGPD